MERPTTGDLLAVNQTLRQIALLGLASLVSGVLVGGIGGRIVMTVSARAAGAEMAGRLTENGNTIGDFTIGGTIALLVFVGLLGGIIGSVGVVAADPWLKWMGFWRGVGYGIVVLSVFGFETFASVDFFILDPVALNVSMFLALFIGFGVATRGAARLMHRRLPEAGDREQVGWLIVVGLGVIPLLMAVLFFTSPSFCGCEPAYEVGVSLLVMVAATVVHHAGNATQRIPAWAQRGASVTGYISLAAAVLFGMLHTIQNIQRLF